jgi:hypothetical protein
MTKGSCLCRAIRFEAGEVEFFGHCHCSMCRKAHGAAFATFACVPADNFRFVAGGELVKLYESSPGNHRAFCPVCGSNAPARSSDSKMVFIPAGLFDDDPGRSADAACSSIRKHPGGDPCELPKFKEYPT